MIPHLAPNLVTKNDDDPTSFTSVRNLAGSWGRLNAPGPAKDEPSAQGFWGIKMHDLPERRDAFQLLQPLHGFHGPEGLVVDASGIQTTARLEWILVDVYKELLDLLLDWNE